MAINETAKNKKMPTSVYTPTAVGERISIACTTKQNVEIQENETLNQKYNILSKESINIHRGDSFKLGWYGIGLKGSRCIGEDDNGLEKRAVFQHNPTDNDMYHPCPFIIRDIDDDLDDVERRKYRLRQVISVGDEQKIVYWAKEMGFENFNPTTKDIEIDPSTQQEIGDKYVPVPGDLSPKPEILNNKGSILASNRFAKTTGKLDLTLTHQELEELKQVCRVLYGDAGLARVGEISIIYGIDTRTDGPIGTAGTVNYAELMAATVAYLSCEDTPRSAVGNAKLPFYFNYGNSIPFLIKTGE